jgi:hypothetical protein
MARHISQERAGAPGSSQDLSGRTTLMITIATGLFATGMLALSLESLGVATALFGIAVLLIRLA